MLNRLMPIARHAVAFSSVISPGLASMVNSCGCNTEQHAIILCKSELSNTLGVPPPI